MTTKSKRGFASMTPERQKELAIAGGKAVAANRDHMRMIGSKGGKKTGENKEHMSEIGRKGGKTTQAKRVVKTISVELGG